MEPTNAACSIREKRDELPRLASWLPIIGPRLSGRIGTSRGLSLLAQKTFLRTSSRSPRSGLNHGFSTVLMGGTARLNITTVGIEERSSRGHDEQILLREFPRDHSEAEVHLQQESQQHTDNPPRLGSTGSTTLSLFSSAPCLGPSWESLARWVAT